MWRSLARLLIVCSLCVGLTPPTAVLGQLSVEAVDRALDIAEKSAERGLVDVSMRAVVGALRFGPPTRVEFPPAVPIRHWGARVDTSQPVPPGPALAVARRVPRLLRTLPSLWVPHTTEQRVYESLRDVVLPAEHPFQGCLYPTAAQGNPLQPDRFVPAPTMAEDLVAWAIRSRMLPDLAEQILARDTDRSPETYALALHVALALDQTNQPVERPGGQTDGRLAERQALADRLQQSLDLSGVKLTPLQADVLTAAALPYYQQRRDLDVAADVFAAVRRSADTRADGPAQPAALLLAARCEFAATRTEAAVESLRVYIGREVSSTAASQARRRRQSVAARELFSRGLRDEAASLLPAEILSAWQRRYAIDQTDRTTSEAAESHGVVRSPSLPRPVRTARVLPADDADVTPQQIRICRLDLETRTSQTLLTLPDFQHVAAPALAGNGRQLAFDACFPGEPVTSAGRIYVVDLQTRQLRYVVDGSLPSWSPGGQRLVYSAVTPSRGVWVVRATGEEAQLIDATGWSARWSPDGRTVGYSRYVNGVWSLAAWDLIENEYFVAGGLSPQRAAISPNFEFTPDSRSMILRVAAGGDRSVLQAVRLLGEERDRVAEFNQPFADEIAIGPNGEVVCCLRRTTRSGEQLYLVGADGPVRIEGQFSDRRNTGATFAPDGRSLLYVSKPGK